MIAVDTNILVYAHRRDSKWHEPARDCVKKLAESNGHWLIPWPCLHEFLSIVTHPRIYNPPSTMVQAIDQIEAWCESPGLVKGCESPEHWNTLQSIALAGKIARPMIYDARVAAICIDHGVEVLWTADRDFSRFSLLKIENPLIASK